MSKIKTQTRSLDASWPNGVRKVPLGKMTKTESVQRDLRPRRVNALLASFDPDMLGTPVLSERDGKYFIVDGQHRVAALKEWLGPGWETQVLECRVYTGLNEKQEAALFDKLNDQLAVAATDRFQTRVTAEEPVETAVSVILAGEGLHVTHNRARNQEGTISCVGTLLRIFGRTDGYMLRDALRAVRDAFGDAGLDGRRARMATSGCLIDGTLTPGEGLCGVVRVPA